MKKEVNIVLVFILLILLLPNISSISNESITAEREIINANFSIINMQNQGIPIKRVTESYNEAWQIYTAQKELEESKKNADYKIVFEKINEVKDIREKAIKARDELIIFNETYFNVKKTTNLSEMKGDYNKIIKSYKEERFEETPKLINKGYDKISEIQASQTTFNLFYSTTTKTIKNFLKKHWKEISISTAVILLILFMFQKAISRFIIKKKLKHLYLRKKTLNHLIKENQKRYFKKGNISKEEYDLKIKKFNEILRDIDRQIPLLKEKRAKVNKKEK